MLAMLVWKPHLGTLANSLVVLGVMVWLYVMWRRYRKRYTVKKTLLLLAPKLVVTLLVVLGAVMWAKVLATFCELATNSDPAALEYRQALDDLNRFCQEQGLSAELKRRLRQFFHQRKVREYRDANQHPLPPC